MALSLLVTLLMVAGLSLFVDIDWGRFPLFAAAIVAGGAGFAAFGAAIGGAAREVRASSLLAFMISLPVAFVSLVGSGTVSPSLFDVIKVIRRCSRSTRRWTRSREAWTRPGPARRGVLHLAILAAAYGALARLALRRFAA